MGWSAKAFLGSGILKLRPEEEVARQMKSCENSVLAEGTAYAKAWRQVVGLVGEVILLDSSQQGRQCQARSGSRWA